jgi:hypothetical protein
VREKESVSEKERVELGIMWLPTPLCPTQKQPAQGNKIDGMVKRHWPSKRHSEEKERRKRGQREERTGVKERSTRVDRERRARDYKERLERLRVERREGLGVALLAPGANNIQRAQIRMRE